jgi:trehalose 6-phosphate phosphatase
MLPTFDDLAGYAVFLDLDGTLADIAERPDAVHVDIRVLRTLQALRDRASGALAIVSGRDIAMIDKMLHPLVLPAGGVHGLQRRDAAGIMRSERAPDVASAALALQKGLGRELGVIIERKAGAVAVHYRLRPDLESRCRDVVDDVLRRRTEFRLLEGKMVLELAPRGANKGRVIETFLREPPFLGRTPIFAGDDLTDEAGFVTINARHGYSIKIGHGATSAKYRVGSAHEFRHWLCKLSEAAMREPAS